MGSNCQQLEQVGTSIYARVPRYLSYSDDKEAIVDIYQPIVAKTRKTTQGAVQDPTWYEYKFTLGSVKTQDESVYIGSLGVDPRATASCIPYKE